MLLTRNGRFYHDEVYMEKATANPEDVSNTTVLLHAIRQAFSKLGIDQKQLDEMVNKVDPTIMHQQSDLPPADTPPAAQQAAGNPGQPAAQTQPQAQTESDKVVDVAECARLADGAKRFKDDRQTAGYRFMTEDQNGAFFGLPYKDGQILIYPDPAKFPKTDPFYNYGTDVVSEFFNFDKNNGNGSIKSIRPAICKPVKYKTGSYSVVRKGDIEFDSQESKDSSNKGSSPKDQANNNAASSAPQSKSQQPVSVQDCIKLEQSGETYSEAREEFSDEMYMKKSPTGGKYFGISIDKDHIKLFIRPNSFKPTDPFYEYGLERIEKFFKINGNDRGTISSITPAILGFKHTTDKYDGKYKIISKGVIDMQG